MTSSDLLSGGTVTGGVSPPHMQVEDIQQALSLKQAEASERQKRISHTRCMITGLQAELENLAGREDVQPEISSINSELRSVQEDKARVESECLDLQRSKSVLQGDLQRGLCLSPSLYRFASRTSPHSIQTCSYLIATDCR